MDNYEIGIYVFSYNRASYLDNFLRSVSELNITRPVFIIDDMSDDKDTCNVLQKYSKKYEVIQPNKDGNDKNYGGLYSNMNYALDHAGLNSFKYALFLQDDTQLVRPITKKDLEHFDVFFKRNLRAFELHIFFEKKSHIKRRSHCTADQSSVAHFRTEEHKGHRGFTDIGLFDVKKTKKYLGKFRKDEFDNEDLALKVGSLVGFYKYPLGHWLPCPKVVRGRKVSKLLLIADKIARADIYPIKHLDDSAIEQLFKLPSNPPDPRYAEDWLETEKKLPYEEWTYGGFSNLIGRKGRIKILGLVLALSFAMLRKVKNIRLFNSAT